MYFIVFPLMKTSFILQNFSPSFAVQMTSRKCMFIHVSQASIFPL